MTPSAAKIVLGGKILYAIHHFIYVKGQRVLNAGLYLTESAYCIPVNIPRKIKFIGATRLRLVTQPMASIKN